MIKMGAMKLFPQNLLFVITCLALGACASNKPRLTIPEAPVKAPAPIPQTVGRVYAVNPRHGFAVIEPNQALETGTELQSRTVTGQQTGALKVTPEKANPFIVADILKGQPQPGDAVTK